MLIFIIRREIILFISMKMIFNRIAFKINIQIRTGDNNFYPNARSVIGSRWSDVYPICTLWRIWNFRLLRYVTDISVTCVVQHWSILQLIQWKYLWRFKKFQNTLGLFLSFSGDLLGVFFFFISMTCARELLGTDKPNAHYITIIGRGMNGKNIETGQYVILLFRNILLKISKTFINNLK